MEIQIFNTILQDTQGKKIIIPNGRLTEGPIENIAEKSEVIAEISLLVDPKVSFEWLEATTATVISKCPYAIAGTTVELAVEGITRDDMKITIGCKVLGEHYEICSQYLYKEIKTAFETAGIALAKERRKENLT